MGYLPAIWPPGHGVNGITVVMYERPGQIPAELLSDLRFSRCLGEYKCQGVNMDALNDYGLSIFVLTTSVPDTFLMDSCLPVSGDSK